MKETSAAEVVANKAYNKVAGVGDAIGRLGARTVEAPFYLGWKTLRGTADAVTSFGSVLSNDIKNVASKVEAGTSAAPKRWVPPVEDVVRVAPDSLGGNISQAFRGARALQEGNYIKGTEDLVNGTTNAALKAKSHPLTEAAVSRIRGKRNLTRNQAGAIGVGSLGLGAVAMHEAGKENINKEAGLSLKTKLKMLVNSKPTKKELATAGIVGGVLGAATSPKALDALREKKAFLGISPLKTVKTLYTGIKQRYFGGSTPGSSVRKFFGEGVGANKPPEWGADIAGRAAARQRNMAAAGTRRANRPAAQQELDLGRRAIEKGNWNRALQIGMSSAKRQAPEFMAGNTGKFMAAAVPLVGGFMFKNKGMSMLRDHAMMNATRKWAPVAGVGLGAMALGRTAFSNPQQKQAGVISKFKNIRKKLIDEIGDVTHNAKTVPQYDSSGKILRNQKGLLLDNPSLEGDAYGYARAATDKLNDYKNQYGPSIALGLGAGKAMFALGKQVQNKYVARQVAKREARELKAIAAGAVGLGGATIALNAYNDSQKYASVAKILAKTPRARNVEEAVSHWANKRDSALSAVDELGERNMFNAWKHDREVRALNEAEESLYHLHKANTSANTTAANAAAPNLSSGVSAKGLLLGAGAGVLGTAAYARKKRDQEAEELAAAYMYSNGAQ